MKIAIVTGASSGIGREFARQIPKLYQKLDEIWVVSRRTERLEQLKEELSVPVRIFDSDLKREYIYERMGRELAIRKPDIRMLVNAAGYGKIGSTEEIDMTEQLGMIDINCRALTKLTGLCLPYMSRGSRILQMASAAAFSPQPGFAVYAASKAYVYSFAHALRCELRQKGILVTAVCPGPVDTEFFEHTEGHSGSTKESFRAEAKDVVRKALLDSVKGKGVSVYGKPMKAVWLGAKLIPYSLSARLMYRINVEDKNRE